MRPLAISFGWRAGACIGAAIVLGAALIGCGGAPAQPPRAVIENDIDGWSFHRFQELLDVEVWVADNAAVGYTASYVPRAADKAGRIERGEVVHAFVTRYERDDGVYRALVQFVRRLAQDSGYSVQEQRLADQLVLVVSGRGELWALWAAKRHVVKIGGRDVADVPKALVEAYGERYPSRVIAGALEGPLPPGSEPGDEEAPTESTPGEPDWDRYDPATELPNTN